MENDALKTFQNDLLYSKKRISLPTGEDWRKHYTTQNADAAKRTYDNLDNRIDKLLHDSAQVPLWFRFGKSTS